jgi:hypothetical protein
VADYTAILSRRLVEVSDGTVEPVLVHAGKETANQIDTDYPVENLSGKCSSKTLAEAVRRLEREAEVPAVVLLEYSGYGYSGRGAPRWLVQGLRGACGEGGMPLITIFHELYANSYKPWDARFWMMPLQRYVTTQLAAISDGIMANWDAAAQWLEGQVKGQPVRMSPTFSNVGEPGTIPDYSVREPYAICFGGAGRKEEMYRQHGKALSDVLRHYGIEQVVDLGPVPAEETYTGMELPVEPKGFQSEKEISEQLKESSLGLLNHPIHCLKKSGVWASYAAHGLPTLIAGSLGSTQGLEEREHYLSLEGSSFSTSRLSSISQVVVDWYRNRACSEKAAHRLQNTICDILI